MLPQILNLMWHDFLPFIFLISALYIIAGGLVLRFNVRATPAVNTCLIAGLSLLANIFGTTGASMLGIHPLLLVNKKRRHVAHTVVFFIFLVGNVGGCLSPVGDPPLFIGFLKGVSFFWPLKNLWAPILFLEISLLCIYWMIDSWFFRHEPSRAQVSPARPKIVIEGKWQLLLAVGVSMVLILPSLLAFDTILGEHGTRLLSLCTLLFLMWVSFQLAPFSLRQTSHQWSFEPLKEVAILFLGIFITARPVIELLAQGRSGPFGFLMKNISYGGNPDPVSYFWVTGLLSSLLDNAPTYLIFFTTAGGQASLLMNHLPQVLSAISLGAVVMGALTYIGNAPNFLVKSIVERDYHIHMPNFLSYTFWSCLVLLPLFALVTYFFFN
jgi:Na+/H+ antiporter NhaD/arsenite permease-like protein